MERVIALLRLLVPVILLACLGQANAQETNYRKLAAEQTFTLTDFAFSNGDTLAELVLTCATWGKPRRSESGRINNAILLCHGTGGSWGGFATWWAGAMFGPGQPLDLSKYYVIATDAIGSGKSSKPSDGLEMAFPNYQLDDVVKAQHRLVAQELGIEELLAVIGTSYGGRQTWQWGIQYPESMRGLVPMISSPFPSAGKRGMMDYLPIEAITTDPTWQNGNYTEQPHNLGLAYMIFWMSIDGVGHMAKAAPTREQSFGYLPAIWSRIEGNLDANDFIYALRVNDTYDAWSEIDKIQANVLIINMAGDSAVPIELGHAEKAAKRLGKKAEYMLVEDAPEWGHFGVGRTTASYGPRLGAFLRALHAE